MPELAEVETVKETLKKHVLDKKIKRVDIYYANVVSEPVIEEFKKKLEGEVINDIKRRGKWLLFEFDHYYLLSHLRMEGKYYLKNENDEIMKHEHVSFIFTDGTCLRYHDTRRFGRMILVDKNKLNECKQIKELGYEPWDKDLTVSYLKDKYSKKRLPIKTVLLDQSIIVGIGNIYADEVLFMSKINPLKKTNELNDKEMSAIIENTKMVLEKAIKFGGTTIKSYESDQGVHGKFQNELLVHNQLDKKCPDCNEKVIKIKVGGRGTYYCSNCQK